MAMTKTDLMGKAIPNVANRGSTNMQSNTKAGLGSN